MVGHADVVAIRVILAAGDDVVASVDDDAMVVNVAVVVSGDLCKWSAIIRFSLFVHVRPELITLDAALDLDRVGPRCVSALDVL